MKIVVEGLEELIKQAEQLATPRELEEVDKKAIKECIEMTKKEVAIIMRKSTDVSKSIYKKQRTFIHSSDKVTTKIYKTKGKIIGFVQVDDGSRKSPWYYTKYDEFGGSNYPPTMPFQRTFKKLRATWEEIFYKYYNELVEKLN